jgi:hypothetical protein
MTKWEKCSIQKDECGYYIAYRDVRVRSLNPTRRGDIDAILALDEKAKLSDFKIALNGNSLVIRYRDRTVTKLPVALREKLGVNIKHIVETNKFKRKLKSDSDKTI